MRKAMLAYAAPVAALALSACGGGSGGVLNRDRPDEFAVTRTAPLVIPPDYALNPPKPGAPRPLETDPQSEALRALFGDAAKAAPKSAGEENLIDKTDATPQATVGARSTVGDPKTMVVNKGSFTVDLLQAGATQDGNTAKVSLGG